MTGKILLDDHWDLVPEPLVHGHPWYVQQLDENRLLVLYQDDQHQFWLKESLFNPTQDKPLGFGLAMIQCDTTAHAVDVILPVGELGSHPSH